MLVTRTDGAVIDEDTDATYATYSEWVSALVLGVDGKVSVLSGLFGRGRGQLFFVLDTK